MRRLDGGSGGPPAKRLRPLSVPSLGSKSPATANNNASSAPVSKASPPVQRGVSGAASKAGAPAPASSPFGAASKAGGPAPASSLAVPAVNAPIKLKGSVVPAAPEKVKEQNDAEIDEFKAAFGDGEEGGEALPEWDGEYHEDGGEIEEYDEDEGEVYEYDADAKLDRLALGEDAEEADGDGEGGYPEADGEWDGEGEEGWDDLTGEELDGDPNSRAANGGPSSSKGIMQSPDDPMECQGANKLAAFMAGGSGSKPSSSPPSAKAGIPGADPNQMQCAGANKLAAFQNSSSSPSLANGGKNIVNSAGGVGMSSSFRAPGGSLAGRSSGGGLKLPSLNQRWQLYHQVYGSRSKFDQNLMKK